MKKVLMMLAIGVLAQHAVAQDEESLIVDGSNSWRVTPVAAGVGTSINFLNDWGEFNLIYEPIYKEDYKGYKVEFSNLKDLDGGGVHLKIGKAVMDGDVDNGVYTVVPLASAENGVLVGEFPEDLDDEVSTFTVQCAKAGESVDITNFTLITADGEEEPAEHLGGGLWGCKSHADIKGVTFKGVYGYEKILAADGSALTYDPEAEKDIVYTYTVVFEQPLTNTLLFEADYLKTKSDGSQSDACLVPFYANEGDTSITFSIDAKNCYEKVSNIYVKANSTHDYPFTVFFKSITRTRVDNTPKQAAHDYSLLTGDDIILQSDLEMFDDNDEVVFYYSYAWDDASISFAGWGMGSLCSAADKNTAIVDIHGASTPGCYEYHTTVKALLDICGHHEAEGEGRWKDNTEWDGLYWFMWDNINEAVRCVTTKIDVLVYTDVEVRVPNNNDNGINTVAGLVTVDESAQVVGTVYYNLAGVMSATPFKGVNIVCDTFSDGSVRVVKALMR